MLRVQSEISVGWVWSFRRRASINNYPRTRANFFCFSSIYILSLNSGQILWQASRKGEQVLQSSYNMICFYESASESVCSRLTGRVQPSAISLFDYLIIFFSKKWLLVPRKKLLILWQFIFFATRFFFLQQDFFGVQQEKKILCEGKKFLPVSN